MILSKKRLFLCVFFALSFFTVHAQEREEFFAAPIVEFNLNSRSNAAFGGGLMLGYGSGVAIGIKTFYSVSINAETSPDDSFPDSKLHTLEMAVFLRLYLPRMEGNAGLFIQVEAGETLFGIDHLSFPDGTGTFSAGLSAGWRFLFGYFYVEPFIRGGYPFMAGAGLYAGFHV